MNFAFPSSSVNTVQSSDFVIAHRHLTSVRAELVEALRSGFDRLSPSGREKPSLNRIAFPVDRRRQQGRAWFTPPPSAQ